VNRNQRRTAAKFGTQVAHFTVASGNFASPNGVAELARRAVQYHQAGHLAEAENWYRQVLAIEPDHFDSLHLLGVLAQQSGRGDLAASLISKAIALSGRGPGDKKNSSGVSSRRRKQALAPRDLAIAHSNLSIVLMALNRPIEALRATQCSLELAETENTRLLFVQAVRALNSVPEGIDLRHNLARALSEPWGRPAYLARFAANVIKSHGKTAAHIRRFVTPGRGSNPPQNLIGSTELADISSDHLLRTLLETSVVFDIDLERYLTAVRAAMLTIACADVEHSDRGKDILRFLCSLARQCFINEYVYVCGHQEWEAVNQLRGQIANALESGVPVSEFWLAAFAAYCPLTSLSAAKLLAQRRYSDPVTMLITQQVQECEQELQLRASVPRLTAIEEGTSRAVRQQYEESPYPRWIKASPVGQSTTVSIHLREQFPLFDPRKLPAMESTEILIAGCGTGQHSIETARQFKRARLLAIDLSLTSLCYALRKTRELNLTNIEYAQADILQLCRLGRQFDVIEASGVLHHLAEPMVGWRVLLSLLRPGGFMRLGLYSKPARRELAAARAFIVQRGYGASPEEIRQCRQHLMRIGQARLADWADFFSTSPCRDLLFHVQEHQITLPEIGAFLQQSQLQFLGFTLPRAVQGSFRKRFPDDITMTNLSYWHIFETENPTTFREMYEFWIRKPT
jgi:2-polyprenyl-3-methyl-5-hydroxy-6-metoxy-1,4-benzoquinol methylase